MCSTKPVLPWCSACKLAGLKTPHSLLSDDTGRKKTFKKGERFREIPLLKCWGVFGELPLSLQECTECLSSPQGCPCCMNLSLCRAAIAVFLICEGNTATPTGEISS